MSSSPMNAQEGFSSPTATWSSMGSYRFCWHGCFVGQARHRKPQSSASVSRTCFESKTRLQFADVLQESNLLRISFREGNARPPVSGRMGLVFFKVADRHDRWPIGLATFRVAEGLGDSLSSLQSLSECFDGYHLVADALGVMLAP